ncbi:MAG: hypothetical protein ACRETN_07590, partial [Nevskiales bacterium]
MEAILFDFATRRRRPLTHSQPQEGAEMVLAVRNWQRFQHYKDRNPPWIKLHHDLLDNYEFSLLPIESRALAPLLWLIASESEQLDGRIRMNGTALAFRLHMSAEALAAALAPLIDKEFLSMEQPDSNPLASHWQVACPETETETEERKSESVRAERALSLARAETNPVEMYVRAFGSQPAIYIQEAIETQIADLKAWEMTLDFWIERGFSKNNLNGLISNYRKCCGWRAQIEVGANQPAAETATAFTDEWPNKARDITAWADSWPDPETRPE